MASIAPVVVQMPDQHTVWTDRSLGVRDNREFKRLDSRVWATRFQDTVTSLGNDLLYGCKTAQLRLASWYTKVHYPQFSDPEPIGRRHSRGLVVMFHGLNGHPAAFARHVDMFSKVPGIDVFVPHVPDKGRSSVECEESKILLSRLVAWTKMNPGMPITFIGHSNGSRFAMRFETWLRKEAPATAVHVCVCGGVLYGSTHVNVLTKVIPPKNLCALSCNFLSPIICTELAQASEMAKSLLKAARKPLEANVADRDYAMYATYNDILIPNRGSSLPVINEASSQRGKTEHHYIVRTHGHYSIVQSFVEKQVQDSLVWMEKQRKAIKSSLRE